MAVTQRDLDSFAAFASGRLSNGGADSLAVLVAEWEAQQREQEATAEDIRQGLADIDAGNGKTAERAFADVRSKLGLSE